jgi:DNA-binding NarL/FixJ family response regulator
MLRARLAVDICAAGEFEIVGSAESETNALAAIRKLCPDVVIADLGLTEGSGVEIVSQVREGECSPRPRVFVLTHHSSPKLRHACLALGAEDFFDKTDDYERFLERMRELAQT